MEIKIVVEAAGVKAAIIHVTGASVTGSAMEFRERILQEAAALARALPEDESVREAVRDMLRHGKYKPAGRGKPASEYLVESAREGEFPFINNFVDALNLISLKYRLPISLADVEKAGTRSFVLRRGKAGESYVFNRSGQVLNVEDLLCLATLEGGEPVAGPVKDSQKTKVGEDGRELLAVIYSPAALAARLEEASRELQNMFLPWSEHVEAFFA